MANSDFQSISDASGVNLSSNIFSGSHFPGSVSYTKAFNSEGNYAVPGIANFVTHGDSDTFGINWSENIPKWPSFSAGFQKGSSTYSVYGSNDQGNNAFHATNLHSFYAVAGFNFGAYYTTGASHSLVPEVIAGEETTETHTDNTTYGFTMSHLLPLHGSFSSNVNRSEWTSDYLGASSSGTIDTINASVTMHPTEKLVVMTNADYSDNLSGQLYEAVASSGGAIPGTNANEDSHSLDVTGTATYNIAPSIESAVFVERREQTFLGTDYIVHSYGGSLTFGHKVLGGVLNGAMSVTDNDSAQDSANSLGLSAMVNYSTDLRGWHVTGAYGYSQNVQTLLVIYTNSFYNYSGTVRRRWGRFNMSMGAGGARTAVTQQSGTANGSQSYNASLSYTPWITANGSYSRSSGQALATGSGLVPIPVPSPILPSNLVSLFGGDSYSFGLTSSPVKKLTLSASYSKSDSNTTSNGVASVNENNQYNAIAQYQLRKITLNSGYARLQQGFSGSSTAPQVISSFYIGVSRWFNFF